MSKQDFRGRFQGSNFWFDSGKHFGLSFMELGRNNTTEQKERQGLDVKQTIHARVKKIETNC